MAEFTFFPPVLVDQENNISNTAMISAIYRDIAQTFGHVPLSNQVQLSNNTHTSIQNKILHLEKLEKELKEEFKKQQLKQELLRASHGHIDLSNVSDDDIPEVLEKHSNLIGMISGYNKQTQDILNILQQINDVTKNYATNGQLTINLRIPGI